jgi:hypothetical protein
MCVISAQKQICVELKDHKEIQIYIKCYLFQICGTYH